MQAIGRLAILFAIGRLFYLPSLEVGFCLTTADGLVNALCRFISCQCWPHTMCSDNGKNFVGAQQEPKKALQDLNPTQINAELTKRGI